MELAQEQAGSVYVSALLGDNSETLIEVIGARLRSSDRIFTLRLPLDRGDLLAAAHREGDVVSQENLENCVEIRVVLDPVGAARFVDWNVAS